VAGIYIHVPFCRKRCSYCDFHFSTTFEKYRSNLIEKISQEISFRKNELQAPLETIYFGGGTPSILDKEELSLLLNELKMSFGIDSVKELTLEVNPEDVTRESLSVWKSLGINRLSMGIQSLKEVDLHWMNRAHTAIDGFLAVKLADQEGFNRINVDLIYGLPDLSLKQWADTLEKIIELPVNHISAYCLTVEQKTALYKLVNKGAFNMPLEEDVAAQFELLKEVLQGKGFDQYEVSNFAKKDGEAIHNTNYWRGKPYLGFGPSAHSYNGKTRRWNVADNLKYLKADFNTKHWFEEELLNEKDKWNELFLTGLRTKWGVDFNAIIQLGGMHKSEENRLNYWESHGCLVLKGHSLVLTQKGMLLADKIAQDFFRIS